MYAVFGGADFGAGFWDLVAGGAKRGERPARGHRPLDRAGVGGEPRLADLHVRAAVDVLPGGVRLDHPHPLRAADPCCLRHRAARSRLRVPQGGVPHPGPAQLRRRLRALVGPGALLPRSRGRRHRLRARAVGGQGRRSLGQLGEPDVHPRRRARRVPWRRTWRRSSWSATPTGSRTTRWSAYFRRRATAAAVAAGRRVDGRDLRAVATTRSTSSTGSRRAPCRWSSSPRLERPRCARAARRGGPARRATGRRRRGGQRRRGLGRGAVGLPAADAA